MQIPKPIKTKKKKVKKPVKLTLTKLRAIEKAQIKKLTKENKAICSQICRLQWNEKCPICGKQGTSAHHFFGWKACSNARYISDNLIWVDFGCHIGKIHQQGLTEPAREKILERIGEERFEALKTEAYKVKKWTLDELKKTNEELLKELEYWSIPF